MALKGMLHREHHILFDHKTVANEVPIYILLVDVDKRWLLWWRRVGKWVCCIDQDGDTPFVCTDGEIHSHARLLNARRVCVCQIQFRGGERGSVTTVTSLASTI
jgi:hypothetical protein